MLSQEAAKLKSPSDERTEKQPVVDMPRNNLGVRMTHQYLSHMRQKRSMGLRLVRKFATESSFRASLVLASCDNGASNRVGAA
jgi:hypothetical protein